MKPNSENPEPLLFDLSRRYAAAADRRDVDRFLSVFAPEGQMSLCTGPDPYEVVRVISGPEELAAVPPRLARYDRTFHFLGQAGYDVDGDRASGEVYCIAHHLTVGPSGAQNKVMYIRYSDEYVAGPAGGWRIVHRRVHVDWTEVRAADAPGTNF
jgi:SnoaL-like domain